MHLIQYEFQAEITEWQIRQEKQEEHRGKARPRINITSTEFIVLNSSPRVLLASHLFGNCVENMQLELLANEYLIRITRT